LLIAHNLKIQSDQGVLEAPEAVPSGLQGVDVMDAVDMGGLLVHPYLFKLSTRSTAAQTKNSADETRAAANHSMLYELQYYKKIDRFKKLLYLAHKQSYQFQEITTVVY
jgi:hypothetical protein